MNYEPIQVNPGWLINKAYVIDAQIVLMTKDFNGRLRSLDLVEPIQIATPFRVIYKLTMFIDQLGHKDLYGKDAMRTFKGLGMGTNPLDIPKDAELVETMKEMGLPESEELPF